jgi:hypothetical protein
LTFDNPISNTINKISKLNNWNNVIPEDDDELNDIKLTDELKKEIIDNFHLNGVKIEKASNKILFKNAYNTFSKKKSSKQNQLEIIKSIMNISLTIISE